VNNEFKQQLAEIRVEVKKLVDQGVAAFNASLKQAGVTQVLQP
jgi:hypothetical protein